MVVKSGEIFIVSFRHMRFKIWKNFPQTSFWLCTSEIFLLSVYTCTPSLRHLIGILSETPLTQARGNPYFTGYTLLLLSFCPSTHGKASTGSKKHAYVYSKPTPPTSWSCSMYMAPWNFLFRQGRPRPLPLSVLPRADCTPVQIFPGQPQRHGQSSCKRGTLNLKLHQLCGKCTSTWHPASL